MRRFAAIGCVLAVGFATASPATAASQWGGTLGGGVVFPQDVAKDHLDRGWNLQSGSTHRIAKSAAILTEVMYTHHSVSVQSLQNLHAPEGSARVLAGTFNLMLGPGAAGSGPYIVGGGGIYNRKIEFDRPTTGDIILDDPWFGQNGPVVIPAGQTIGSFSTTKPGLNAGVGINLGKKVYLEARYHWIFTDQVKTTFIPVNFGLRW